MSKTGFDPKNIPADKEVFTTFEVARICNANITSVKNWIQDGKIRAFQTPGGHNRIERAVLKEFLDRYKMPNPFTAKDRKVLYLVGLDLDKVEIARRHFGRTTSMEATDSLLEAALNMSNPRADVVLFNLDAEFNGDVLALLRLMQDPRFNWTIICYGTKLDPSLLELGVSHLLERSGNDNELHELIRRALL